MSKQPVSVLTSRPDAPPSGAPLACCAPLAARALSTEEAATVAGRRILLIDDVLTTGATLDACARALLHARARNVDVLTFARVVDSV